MAGYGEPDWVSKSQDNSAPVVADANLGPNVTAGSITGGYVTLQCVTLQYVKLWNTIILQRAAIPSVVLNDTIIIWMGWDGICKR